MSIRLEETHAPIYRASVAGEHEFDPLPGPIDRERLDQDAHGGKQSIIGDLEGRIGALAIDIEPQQRLRFEFRGRDAREGLGQAAAQRSEAIVHPWENLLIVGPLYEIVALQLLEVLDPHLVADVAHRPPQPAVADRAALCEEVEDQRDEAGSYELRWCGRRDSNPHSLSRSRFSYHFGFRRRLIGVRGLDYPFAKAFRP
jgi:hypothetical protein